MGNFRGVEKFSGGGGRVEKFREGLNIFGTGDIFSGGSVIFLGGGAGLRFFRVGVGNFSGGVGSYSGGRVDIFREGLWFFLVQKY